jgi:hypothetical protein
MMDIPRSRVVALWSAAIHCRVRRGAAFLCKPIFRAIEGGFKKNEKR